MKIDFTEAEVNSLLGFIDLAVKATGLSAAKDAVYFHDKFQKAFDESNAPQEPEDDVE